LINVDSAPSRLEQTLGRLVEAGITHADDLASSLGLESHHIRRPLRKLTLAGVLDSEPSGRLQLTPAGRTWLRIELTPKATEPLILPEPIGCAAPAPLKIDVDEDRIPVDAEAELPPLAEPTTRWRPRLIAVAGVRAALARVGMAVPRVRLELPAVQVTLDGIALSTSTARRIAVVAASAVALMIAVQLGLTAWPVTAVAPLVDARTAHDDPPALATAPTAAPVATPGPAAASAPSERWVVVYHTNGLGLVLRPAPASTARVLTLKEGARLRVTGDPFRQAGRAWLPVASQNGKTGWVASEFVAPEP